MGGLTADGGRSRGRSSACCAWSAASLCWPLAFFLSRFSCPLDFDLLLGAAVAVPLMAGWAEAMAVAAEREGATDGSCFEVSF